MATLNLVAAALAVMLLLLAQTGAQNPKKRLVGTKPPKGQCCDEVRALKVQVANLSSLLGELSRKQETDQMGVVRKIMELEKHNHQQEARVTEAESKYSEINNRVEIMQLQALQSPPQTSSSGERQGAFGLLRGEESRSSCFEICLDSFVGFGLITANQSSLSSDRPQTLFRAHLLQELELCGYLSLQSQ